MILDLIKESYGDNIELQTPLDIIDSNLPDSLVELLQISNGIMETMTHPKTGEKMEIGWIVYSYDEIISSTGFYKEEYSLPGIVFSDDGAGNPFYISEGKVYEFDPIDNESIIRADSLEDFFKLQT